MVVLISNVIGQNNNNYLNVLDQNPNLQASEEMMRKYIRILSYEALDKRLDKYELLKTVEQISTYQAELKKILLRQLNLPEKKTALNAHVVEKKKYKDYNLEKILYESQPGFYVSALLYLPLTQAPYPGVLVLCGHDDIGKAGYQEICIGLARNGMAALCPDPIGQGERKQILDKNGKGIYRATTEHHITGIAPILLGRSLASYMIWDGIRAIDYLVSRSDIDSSNIGCTGHSGGGNRTSYLMALDDRIKSAAPSGFVTTTRKKNDGKGPGDAEQNIHGQLAFGLDLPDYLIMRAPKPTLILSATQDFVPIEGAWEAFRQAKRIYTRFGFAENIDLVETDYRHAFSTDLRVGAIRWMRRWLMGIDDAVTEDTIDLKKTEELFCSPEGQVLFLPGARSIFEFNIEKEMQYSKEREEILKKSSIKNIQDKIREVCKIRKYDKLPDPEVIEKEVIEKDGYSVSKLILRWDKYIQLPALLFNPLKASGDQILYLHDEGKNKEASAGGEIETFVKQGKIVLAVDLRGFGETQTTPWRYVDAHKFTGHDVAEFYIAYMLDKTFLGMRAEDILVCAKYLNSIRATENNKSLDMVAIGETGPAALHTMVLEPDRFSSLTLKKSLNSWKSIVRSQLTVDALNNVVHGALKYYDLPDIVSLVDSNRVIIQNPVDAQGMIISNND